jgi:alpha-beta hydrolase superfamily lysophospholipase
VTSRLRATLVALGLLAATPFGLIASDPSRDRTGAASLNFPADRPGIAPAPLEHYVSEGARLGLRRYPSGRGDGPLLVFVHGSGWHGLAYDALARRIAETGAADVILPDLRGHGPAPQRRGDLDDTGQLERDLATLIAQERRPGQRVVLGGHSSGGGLVLRLAGGPHGGVIDAAILLAPYLGHAAPTTRPGSGGWAEARVRRIVGLSILNGLGIHALDHLPVLDFAFPRAAFDGPLGATATRSYSHRMAMGFAPRADYAADIARLPPFLLVAGAEDEAFVAAAYAPTMAEANAAGRYVLLPGTGHLGVIDAEGTLAAILGFLGPGGTLNPPGR